jgi:hypothetical protein
MGATVKESPQYSLSFFSGWARRRVVRSVSHFACQEGYLVELVSRQAHSCFLSLACRDVAVVLLLRESAAKPRLQRPTVWRNHAVAGFREQHKKATRRLLGRHPTLAEDENASYLRNSSEIMPATFAWGHDRREDSRGEDTDNTI